MFFLLTRSDLNLHSKSFLSKNLSNIFSNLCDLRVLIIYNNFCYLMSATAACQAFLFAKNFQKHVSDVH